MGAWLPVAHRLATGTTIGLTMMSTSSQTCLVQTRLVQTRFVVIGAGGLGCPALLGLAAGGARHITIIDDDHVDLGNLPRQVLYASADVGVAKVDAARWSLLARQRVAAGELELETLRRRLQPGELPQLLDELAPAGSAPTPVVVLECSDSPSLKFAVHDACVARETPVVVGGVVGWHGQAMAVDPRVPEAACYRCLFESPPPRELAPACASAGVSGPAAGVLGHAVAMLAVTLAGVELGEHESAAGVCLHFDLLRGSVRRLAPAPRPDCPACRRDHPQREHGANFNPE